MTYEETDALLTEHGFTLECFSPLEISCDHDGSRATGICAEYVIKGCQKFNEEIANDQEIGGS